MENTDFREGGLIALSLLVLFGSLCTLLTKDWLAGGIGLASVPILWWLDLRKCKRV